MSEEKQIVNEEEIETTDDINSTAENVEVTTTSSVQTADAETEKKLKRLIQKALLKKME